MPFEKITCSFYPTVALKDWLEKNAKKEHRSLSKQVLFILTKAMEREGK